KLKLAPYLGLCLLLACAPFCQASMKAGVAYQKHDFTSQIDGSSDSYALSWPNSSNGRPVILLVYLHSLGQDFTEPYKIPPGASIATGLTKEFPQLAILSCNYGKTPSWGVKLAQADITENIRSVLKEHPVDQIVLAGNAMGACSALLYACTA